MHSVDLSKYAKALEADDGECLYVVGEISDLAQKAQRELDVATYLPPIVVGSGEGATFAYAALADAPDNTLGGAVGIGFENRLGLKLRFCPGAKATPALPFSIKPRQTLRAPAFRVARLNSLTE
ncbi:hypothetical protein [Mesorhizobium sp. L48C026A00]|uniref:hypothetical protein n=1 Tax=Mesorhizobium sp. L48C026A00 TaxID=1287182 RepID=UPI0003CFDF2F|nr:hypothetical protein [Mesorhizobium sp. L48C026A00]ESZ13038.1 hypothetical protein X737_26540 [Mesorhizobium sp. L48C026A00]